MESLSELLEEQLKDLYSAENQLTKALPRMAKKAMTQELKDGFTLHLEETQVQIDRLTQVAEILGVKPTGKVCAAMKGLIEEGKEVLEEDGRSAVIDAALIAAAQRIEHYEISAYGTVKAIAKVLGRDDVVALFDETLQEEIATDEKLTACAETAIYPNAPKSEEESGEDEDEDEDAAPTGKGGTKPPGKAAASKGGKNSGGAKNLKKGAAKKK